MLNVIESRPETTGYKKNAMRVSSRTVVINLFLSAFKLFCGIAARSSAMVSDAVHSASDVLSTIVVMLGVNMASKASDSEHPYGHERFECVASILLAGALFATGIGIGYGGVRQILSPSALAVPGMLALVAAIVSIVVKEWMFWYTRSVAKKINSSAVMADAWHHRSDALSSVGALAGIAAARMGYPIFDPIASLVICLFIVKVSYDIFRDAIGGTIDKSCDEKTQNELRDCILSIDGVKSLDAMTTRLFGPKLYVDLEIGIDGALSVSDGHAIVEAVHRAIETNFDNVKHCMVHANPAGQGAD